MTVSRPTLEELGLEPTVAVRDLLLVGGPAGGGHVQMPAKGTGEFVLQSLPIELEEYQDAEGEWKCHIIGGGGTTDPLTGEPLGSMVYYVDADRPGEAWFVRSDHNPIDSESDYDLPMESAYLNNAARTTEEIVTESDA
jgi:hypothetical protein